MTIEQEHLNRALTASLWVSEMEYRWLKTLLQGLAYPNGSHVTDVSRRILKQTGEPTVDLSLTLMRRQGPTRGLTIGADGVLRANDTGGHDVLVQFAWGPMDHKRELQPHLVALVLHAFLKQWRSPEVIGDEAYRTVVAIHWFAVVNGAACPCCSTMHRGSHDSPVGGIYTVTYDGICSTDLTTLYQVAMTDALAGLNANRLSRHSARPSLDDSAHER